MSTPPDRGAHPNRKYELSLEDEIRRRIPQEGFRGTAEALNHLYPTRTPDPTAQAPEGDYAAGGEVLDAGTIEALKKTK